MEKEILIVMPYKHSEEQGNEIKLTLTGWEKFCTFNFHFVVIGDYSDEIKEEFPLVDFIYCKPIEKIEGQYTPHIDIQHKMEIIMNLYADKYDGFIRTPDDVYPIKPFTLEDIIIPHFHSDDITNDVKDNPSYYWNHDKWKTKELLKKENLPQVDYTTHYPYYYEFNKLKVIWNKYNMRNESYVLEDIYFNYFEHTEPILDSSIRFRVERRRMYQKEFIDAINNPNIKFINNTVNTWCEDLENNLYYIYKKN